LAKKVRCKTKLRKIEHGRVINNLTSRRQYSSQLSKKKVVQRKRKK
jgi:hypothetical protein